MSNLSFFFSFVALFSFVCGAEKSFDRMEPRPNGSSLTWTWLVTLYDKRYAFSGVASIISVLRLQVSAFVIKKRARGWVKQDKRWVNLERMWKHYVINFMQRTQKSSHFLYFADGSLLRFIENFDKLLMMQVFEYYWGFAPPIAPMITTGVVRKFIISGVRGGGGGARKEFARYGISERTLCSSFEMQKKTLLAFILKNLTFVAEKTINRVFEIFAFLKKQKQIIRSKMLNSLPLMKMPPFVEQFVDAVSWVSDVLRRLERYSKETLGVRLFV